ncbi:aldo/keto reductase [Halobacillus hunanensis]|uniref:aldo/keto reductase n=1 Tax=Halobacillus hunanensis TaxID=578214 RepID=UPI0009A5FDB4|nr:aldo/keto reductase [Halobacillus hunanensis]
MSLTDTTQLSNGVHMPWVGLGVYKMDSGDEVVNAVRSALDLGYRHLDTASFYDNEEGVGQAIRESDLSREELFVTTKVWNDEQGYEETLEAFDRSLRKLGLVYLDLYLIHWPIEGSYKDTWKALEKLYKDGKVKAIGVSNFMTHHLDDLLQDAEVTPMVNQIEFHPELYQAELVDYCKQRSIQVEAWSPIGRGTYLDNSVLQELAEKYKKTPAQIILRWDLQHGIVTIPKSTHKVRQKENADVFDFELAAAEMDKINSLDKNNRLGPHPDEMGK